MKKITNPHDKLFRASMMQIQVARDFLNAHLPRAMKQMMNLDELHYVQKSFVDKKLQEQIVDVLYQTKIKDKTGYIYILCEHQSTVQKLLPLRMIKYILEILSFHQDSYAGQEFPIIYPMIFYTGSKRYTQSTNFFDLFGNNKKRMQTILTQPLQLIEVNKLDDREQQKHIWSGTLAYIYINMLEGGISYKYCNLYNQNLLK
ncbi:MAG: Rpn family recombination-promoting nuclease/putative transposase [Pseudomonadota bacterium]